MMNMMNISFDLNVLCLFQSKQVYNYLFLLGGSRMVMARRGLVGIERLGDTLTVLLVLDLPKYIQGIVTHIRNI